MAKTPPPGTAARGDLAPRLIRVPSSDFDRHAAGGTDIAVPAGTLRLTGSGLGGIVGQVSTRPPPVTGPGTPAAGQARPPGKGPGR